MFIVPGTFGSLPQYLWIESGTNWGVATDSNDPASERIRKFVNGSVSMFTVSPSPLAGR